MAYPHRSGVLRASMLAVGIAALAPAQAQQADGTDTAVRHTVFKPAPVEATPERLREIGAGLKTVWRTAVSVPSACWAWAGASAAIPTASMEARSTPDRS